MKLSVYRAAANLTQLQFADRIGVSKLSVAKYESGSTIPSVEVMERIHRETGGAVQPNDFYNLEEIRMEERGLAIGEKSPDGQLVTIGLMSGTSMDGVDAALLITDGEGAVKAAGDTYIGYDPEFKTLIKGAEFVARECRGNTDKIAETYCKLLGVFLKEMDGLSDREVGDALNRLNDYFVSTTGEELSYEAVINRSTDLHAEAVEKLLDETGYRAKDIDLIGYHGQTLFHLPAERITLQVGSGQRLADRTGIPVVFDFRSRDVQNGGQGAPFAPLYHEVLAKQAGLFPLAVVNCGGIANITMLLENDKLYAYDTGPGNTLIDRFVHNKVGKKMDEDGLLGKAGAVDEAALAALKENGVLTADGGNYLPLPAPKSLDSSNLHLVPELDSLTVQDGCRTLEAFTAECIVDSLDLLDVETESLPALWVVAGGGWKNPVILSEFEERLKLKLSKPVRVQHAEAVGWSGDALEAQIFAYLAVRSLRKMPLSLPGTTGVPEPMTGGELVFPERQEQKASRKVKKVLGG